MENFSIIQAECEGLTRNVSYSQIEKIIKKNCLKISKSGEKNFTNFVE